MTPGDGKADERVFVKRPLAEADIRKIRMLAVAGVLLVATLPFLPWLLRGAPPRLGWDDAVMGLAMVALLLWLPIAVRMDRTSRLTIGASGLRYECDLPRRLAWLANPNWSARWDEIKHVRVFKRAAVVALVIKGHSFTRRLELLGWSPQNQAPDGMDPRATKLDDSPVWHELVARGHPAFKDPKDVPVLDFDIAGHPATRAALMVSAILFGAGLVAIASESETYIADGYRFLIPHIAAGVAGLLGFWFALARVRQPVKLPWAIPPGVAIFGGIAASIFSYGGLVLANKAVAPAVPAAYSLESCTTLVPADPDLPRIIWTSGFSDYWCQFKPGTEFMIPVRKGMLGSYQFDQGHYAELARAWRDVQRRKARHRK